LNYWQLYIKQNNILLHNIITPLFSAFIPEYEHDLTSNI